MYPFKIGLVASSPDLWEQSKAAVRDLPVRIVFEMAGLESDDALLDKVDRYCPDILLIEVAGIEDRLHELFRSVLELQAAPKVFALSSSSDPKYILAAMRAGGSEYIFPPVADPLVAALERMSRDYERSGHQEREEKPKGRAIGFLSVKGGCGATTLACHVASEMQARAAKAAKAAKQVLLADLDLDCGIIRFLMQGTCKYSVLDAIRNLQRLDSNYWSGLVSNSPSGFDIMGSAVDGPRDEDFATEDVRHVLRFMRTQYGHVVADLGRGLDEFRLQTLHEIDELVLVSTLEVPSLHRATALSNRILDSGFSKSRLRFVINRVPRNTDVEIEDVEKALGLTVFTWIPDDPVPLEAAYRKGRLLAADEPLRRRFGKMADKLTGVEVEAPPIGKKKYNIFSFDALKEAVS